MKYPLFSTQPTFKISLLVLVGLMSFLLISFTGYSQTLEENFPVKKSRQHPDGTYSLIQFAPEKGLKNPLTLSSANLVSILGLPATHELKLKQQKSPVENAEIVYEEFFKNIPIAFSRIKVQATGGQIKSIAGRYYRVPDQLSVIPKITEATALENAKSFVGAKKYSWESNLRNEPELTSRPKGELVLMENFPSTYNAANNNEAFVLCFKFKIYAVEPLSFDEVFVDAKSGQVVFINPIIKHGEGIADTKYSGQRSINTILYGGNYVLADTNRHGPVETLNLKKGYTYSAATLFTDKDNQWTNAEYNNSALDNAALDAQWGSGKTFEYFKSIFNRNGIDGKGFPLKNYVHAGNKYNNAFWDGYGVTYGDGDSVNNGPFTSIDICAHEIAHGICQFSANLIYFNESGAINESLSDIWGACIKHYAAPEKNHWLIGDEISRTNSYLRSFINPKSKSQPDTYKGTNWYTGDFNNGGVHTNSGVMNHWFYMLVTGKTGTNDKGFNYQVEGIGIEKAAAIVYRAETEYLYPTAKMIDARIATIVAAADLYGENSIEALQVQNAWDAVAVTENMPSPVNLVVRDSIQYIQLGWDFAEFFTDFDGFIIERQTGIFGSFAEIGRATPEIREFKDFTFAPDSLLTYRIMAYDGNKNSDTILGFISHGTGPFIMKMGTFSVCNQYFMDPGGPLNYKNNSGITTTFRPADPGKKIGVRFLSFSLQSGYDNLEVFNGPGTNSQYLGNYNGKNIPSFFKSTDTSGALTFRFRSDTYTNDSGWIAEIVCLEKNPQRPVLSSVMANLPSGYIDLFWTDPSNNEAGFIIERAVNDSSKQSFIEVARVGPNTTHFRDTTYPLHAAVFYRVAANYIADTATSNFKWVYSGDQPFIMNHGMMIATCNKSFLDPGGMGNYPVPPVNTSQVVVFIPSKPDSKVEINFSKFKLNSPDYLKIYDGWGTDKPVIGTYGGYSAKPAKVRSTSDDGRLTVEFYRYNYSYADTGWVANVGCYSFISNPVLLSPTPIGNPAKKVQITWLDRSNIEESYIVQRAINDSTKNAFETISILPPNTNYYVDTLPVDDAVYFYRIIGTSKGDSTKSLVMEYYSGNYPILMPNNVEFVTCDKTFMDPGGLSMYAKPNQYSSIKTTFAPANPADKLRVSFSSLKLGDDDYLRVYEGGTNTGRQLGFYSKTSTGPTLLKSSSADGKLTFDFYRSPYGSGDSGWVAKISCYKPVHQPVIDSIVKVIPKGTKIYWKEGSGNATAYIIQRSLNDSTRRYMKTIATVPGDIKFFEDTSNIENAWAFYTIIAVNENDSIIGLNKGLLIGTAPRSLKDGEKITTCDLTLLDMGGIGTYPYFMDQPYQKTILYPNGAGKKLSIEFIKLDLSQDETLRIYDGSTNSSAYLLAELKAGSPIPPLIKSKSISGILTITYNIHLSTMDYGAWEAKIACYSPMPAPKLDSLLLKNQKMNLQWTDRSLTESSFIVQRALNDSTPQSFATIALLNANTTAYADSTYPANGQLFYRVGAIEGTDTVYSNILLIRSGRIPIIMNSFREITSCDAVFLDPGGLGDYSKFPPGSMFYTIIRPNRKNTVSEIYFTRFFLNLIDQLDIYSGEGEYPDSLVGSYNHEVLPSSPIRSQSPSGSLYIAFRTYDYPLGFAEHGWVANISCYKPIRAPEWVTGSITPAGLVSLKWKNTPDDETNYLVQHAVNQPHFQPGSFTGIRPANDTIFTHNTPQTNAVNFYRIASLRGLDTAWSEVFSIGIGDAPLISEKDSVLVTCQELFLDPGGIGMYQPEKNLDAREVTTTFTPGIDGKKIGIDFQSFKLDWNDNLEIFNGDNLIYDNLIDRYHGFETRKPGRILSKSPDGKLTVRFTRLKGNAPDSGWEARVYCYEEINRPTNPIVKRAGVNKFKINFTDNSNNESGFVLEKCAGVCTNYTPVDTLAQNITEFLDSVPANIGQVRYRVRAIYEDFTSDFSDTAILMNANGPLNILNANVSFTSLDFYDSGGPNSNYKNNENFKTRFYPLDSAKKVKLTFESFSTEPATDAVEIFAAARDDAMRISYISGNYIVSPILSRSVDGTLRLEFRSNSFNTYAGWKAKVTTSYGLHTPYSLLASVKDDSHVLLTFSDTNSLPVQFMVERSYNDSLNFATIALVAPGTLSYVDSNVVSNTKIYYRVAAWLTDEKSTYSPISLGSIGTNCINPALTSQSAKGTVFANQVTHFFTDKNCNLIAKLESGSGNPLNLRKVQASVWVPDTLPSFNGAKYGKRHYNIIPENYVPGNSSWLTLYFTQDEFNAYNSQTNSKLLPRNPGDTARYRNIRILGAATNSIELQTPDSYPLPPVEVNVASSNIKFNAGLNAYEIKVLLTGSFAFFLSSANDTVFTSCRLDDEFISIQANKTGYTYQWQKEGSGGFEDLQDDGNFKNTRTPVLQFRKGSLPDGAKVRCMVYYSPSKTFIIYNKEMEWIGVADSEWSNPANWSCGQVPGQANRVRIKPGTPHLPVISADITLKDLMVYPGANVSILPGIHVILTN